MSLTGARMELGELLKATGYPVSDHVPDQIEPPCLVVAPAENYIGPGQVHGEVLVSLDVWVLVEMGGDNELIANALDKAVEQVIGHLGDWMPSGTGQPGPVESSGWDAHGVNITVSNFTNLTTL